MIKARIPPAPGVFVPSRMLRALLKNAPRGGVDVAALLRRHDVAPEVLTDDAGRVTVESFSAIYKVLLHVLDDEGLGYFPRQIPVGTWALMCCAGSNSPTLSTALDRYCRFVSIVDMGYTMTAQPALGSVAVRLIQRDATWKKDPFVDEWMMFLCHRFCAWLIQRDIPLSRVRLPQRKPPHDQQLRGILPASVTEFDAPHAEISFSEHFLDERVQHDERALRDLLREPVLTLIRPSYGARSWTARTRYLLRSASGAFPPMETVARDLHVHPQYLRRRLADEGTSFKALASEEQRETAIHYLRREEMPTDEVAQRAGFAETSAFIRAFKRWTGLTPAAYRRSLAQPSS